jgi:hypothetical protein
MHSQNRFFLGGGGDKPSLTPVYPYAHVWHKWDWGLIWILFDLHPYVFLAPIRKQKNVPQWIILWKTRRMLRYAARFLKNCKKFKKKFQIFFFFLNSKKFVTFSWNFFFSIFFGNQHSTSILGSACENLGGLGPFSAKTETLSAKAEKFSAKTEIFLWILVNFKLSLAPPSPA